MTADIAEFEGRPAMVYNDELPWHGLGTQAEDPRDVQRTLDDAGLNWTVEKVPMYLKESGKLGRMVPGRSAIVRVEDQLILGTAGKLFTPVQNADAFAPLQIACDQFGAEIQSAGALGNGDRQWMLLSLPGDVLKVSQGDELKPFFLVANAHTSERSQSLTARFTAVRVVCSNTLSAAMKADRAAVAIPHHKNANDRLDEISEVIERMYRVYQDSVKVFKAMSRVKITPEQHFDYLKSVFKLRDEDEDLRLTKALSVAGAREQEGRVSKVFEARDNAMWFLDNGKGTGRTAWGAWNAVTEYIDHVSILKKDGHLRKDGFETAVFGYGAYTKQRALDLALARWMEVKKN